MATQMSAPPLAGLTGLARRLVAEQMLSEAETRRALQEAATARVPLARHLVQNALVDARRVMHALSIEFGVPAFDLNAIDLGQVPVKLVSEDLLRKHRVLPLFKRGNRLTLGTGDPANSHALDEIKFHSNLIVEAVLVDETLLEAAIDTALQSASTTISGLDNDDDLDALSLENESAAQSEEAVAGGAGTDEAPIVKYVNKILLDAIRRGASDIHFEPYEKFYRVRYRIDGVLRTVSNPPAALSPRISARLKVMAQLDIAERRVPQDGRMKLNIGKGKSMDFRVSTLPILAGEKVVLRILDGGAAKLGIDKLGYEEDQKHLFLDAIHKPYGMVLVTGPTGSGKTVSLYTALNILNTEGRNISTSEDPVEIRVAGINQVQMNEKQGMTFAKALRSFLRQDPDVIMVGEIRDTETAEIAIKAAQTGHLVLSTLHTNDAPLTIARLMNMGIAPYNITSAVLLVIAQRLARRLHDCKKPMAPLPSGALKAEGFTDAQIAEIEAGRITLYDAAGCPQCNEGYKGRMGIYQVMPMTEEIQRIVLEGGNALQIAAAAKTSGVRDLRESALIKVLNGFTSLAEINRVTKD